MTVPQLQRSQISVTIKTDDASMRRARCFAASSIYRAFDVAGAMVAEEKRGQGTLCLGQHLERLRAEIGRDRIPPPSERAKLYWNAPGCPARDLSVATMDIDLKVADRSFIHPHDGKTHGTYSVILELPPTVPWKHYFYREAMNFRLPELHEVEIVAFGSDVQAVKLKLLEMRLSNATNVTDGSPIEVNAAALNPDYRTIPPLNPIAPPNHVCALITEGVVTFWHESGEHGQALIVPAEHYISIVQAVGTRLSMEPLFIMPTEFEKQVSEMVASAGNKLVSQKAFDYKNI